MTRQAFLRYVFSALSALNLAIVCQATALADAATTLSKGDIDSQKGQEVYRHVCQGCHMPDGRGAIGAAVFPALADNEKLEVAGYPISVVLNGFGGMPWFNGVLTDLQIAAVVTYIRTHFGNKYDYPVTLVDVAAARGPVPTPEK